MRNIKGSRRRRSDTWTSRDDRDPPGQTGTDPATIQGIPGGRGQLQGQEEQEDIIWLPGNFIQTSTDIQVDHLHPKATLLTTPDR